jgi:hypothetical protein
MPRETRNGYWDWSFLEGLRLERIRVPVASPGISQQSPVAGVLHGFNEEKKTMPEVTVLGEEFSKLPSKEKMIHDWKNPRATNSEPEDVDPLWADSLPAPGSFIMVLFPRGTRGDLNTSSFYSHGYTARVVKNTRDSVWFETTVGIDGIVCTCKLCARCWKPRHEVADWLASNPNGQHDFSYFTNVQATAFRDRPTYRQILIGHLGKAAYCGLYSHMGDLAQTSRSGSSPLDVIMEVDRHYRSNVLASRTADSESEAQQLLERMRARESRFARVRRAERASADAVPEWPVNVPAPALAARPDWVYRPEAAVPDVAGDAQEFSYRRR